jgi:hypothetical protein
MYTTFDPRVEVGGVNLFLGEFTKLALRQNPSPPHHVSNRAIDPTREFYIDMEWRVTGAEVPMRMHAVGDWQIYAYAESVGPGPELHLKDSNEVEPKGPILPGTMTWNHTFTVPANRLPEHTGTTTSGVYMICVVVFANSNLPGPGNDVVGFGEIPVVLSERPQ